MSLISLLNSVKSFIAPSSCQTSFIRYGHQLCTRNQAGRPRNKRRGIKRGQNSNVKTREVLVTQRTLKFHPGMNVSIDDDCTLRAIVPGKVKITCEKFNPNFNHKLVIKFYENRGEQEIYKKYFNVVPYKQENKFILSEVV